MFIEILFKILLFKGGVLIYAEHCTLSLRNSKGAFTPDANDANKLRYSREVGHLNILSLLAPFTREIHYKTDAKFASWGGRADALLWLYTRIVCRCKSYAILL